MVAMRMTFWLLVVLACPPAVQAQDLLAREAPPVVKVQTPGAAAPDCYCRGARGQMFAPGETICLRTAQGSRIARCQMEINVMSWGITETPCPES
jgi:hypothetical protein